VNILIGTDRFQFQSSIQEEARMPTVHSPTPHRPKFRRLAEAARVLAPIIAQIRDAGYERIDDIAMILGDLGLLAPSGMCFTYETTRQLLKEIEAHGLGEGPRSRSEAAAARGKSKSRYGRYVEVLPALQAWRKREHPELN
jgi:hypothetical protein